jgi:SpoVK/Ycf46/Vps4 family AAA+-type ATPase
MTIYDGEPFAKSSCYGDTKQYTRYVNIVKYKIKPAQLYYDFYVPGFNNYWACGLWHSNTGKSVVAGVAARVLGLPLVTYNFGAIFGSLVGQSESTQRRALRQISALGPIVLLIDEADKAFAGVTGASGDSGTSQRVFGDLLSWLANDNQEAFIIMTMNRLAGVPIETVRSGRIEATFYTTFPGYKERERIFKIKLIEQGCPAGAIEEALSDFEWKTIIDRTNEYTGAELEGVVTKAVRTAFATRQVLVPNFDDLTKAVKWVTPVARLDKANIDAINTFCKDTAVAVTTAEPTTVTRTGKIKNTGPSAN